MMFDKFRQALAGWPDDLLTAGLVITAAVLLLVALFAPPIGKLAVLAWALFP